MRSNSNRQILKALLEDNGPFDVDTIPVPERREQLSAFLAQEKDKFVTIGRVHGKPLERDLSR